MLNFTMQSDDQIEKFESRFKSAYKEPYTYEDIELSKIAVISKEDLFRAEQIQEISSKLMPKYLEQYQWSFICENNFSSVKETLERLEEQKPDLIIMERNIKISEESLVYGLSPYVETITQVTTTPVLILPNMDLEQLSNRIKNCDCVMAETDRLTGDSRLINWAVNFVEPKGKLYLNHIEDSKTFNRYMDVIEKIPEISSEVAKEKIAEGLLKLPRDFIKSVTEVLEEKSIEVQVEGFVTLGSSIKDYKDLIKKQDVDLLIFNSKDDDHLSMEGITYEIAVEFKQDPLLLL